MSRKPVFLPKKSYRMGVVDKFGHFIGIVKTHYKNEKLARNHLLLKAKKIGKPYGVMFYG